MKRKNGEAEKQEGCCTVSPSPRFTVSQLPRFLKFALVGGTAFVVDASVFLLFFRVLEFATVPARCLGFGAGLAFTWLLNRRFTFASQALAASVARSLSRYVICNLLGGVVNVALSAYLIESIPLFHAFPVFAVATGSLAGLAVNFTLTSRFVFASQNPNP